MLQPENIVTYPLSKERLCKYVENLLPGHLKEGEYYEFQERALIQVPGGYFLIDIDACCQVSETQLRPDVGGNRGEITERVQLLVRVNQKTPLPGGGHSVKHNKQSFYIWFDCIRLMKYFINQDSKTLPDFIRYNYNPRVTKNTAQLIDEINALIQEMA